MKLLDWPPGWRLDEAKLASVCYHRVTIVVVVAGAVESHNPLSIATGQLVVRIQVAGSANSTSPVTRTR